MKTNRRSFLQAGALVGAGFLTRNAMANFPAQRFFQNTSPIDLINDPISSTNVASSLDFNGDDINRPHDILWNLDEYLRSKGGEPAISDKRDFVVVGGGISGLLSAYYLRDKKPLLLEQATQFGGNSRGEKYGRSQYSTGAAYFCVPDEGSSTETLLTDLNLLKKARLEEDTQVFHQGKVTPGFWDGATDPAMKGSIQAFHQEMKRILEEKYPDIPHISDSAVTRSELNELDRITFAQWLDQNMPGVSEHVKEYCQLYAWSSFVGSIDELSAAQMLNFVTAETGGIMTLPGGNGAIAQGLYESLVKTAGPDSVRAGCMVLRVKLVDGGVEVLFEDEKRNVKKVFARKVIMAAPKFVAKYILPQLELDQKKSFESLKYRGYLVANVLMKKQFKAPSYELYCLEGQMPETPMAMTPPKRPFTDVCFGSWAQNDDVDHSVLTIYKALPMDGARQFLFSPFAHDKNKKVVEDGLVPLLKGLGMNPNDVLGTRMTRWGHSLPVASQGFIASGQPELVSRPMDERIYFVNQDNWANPCFECGHQEAVVMTEKARL